MKKQDPNKVNPNSPKQVSALLYEKMGLPVQRHLKTKKVTTDKSAIKKLKKLDKSGIVVALEVYREADKERATYGESLLDNDGRMRSKYSQTVTDTGRLSSRQTDWGTGTDQQNLPPEFRKICIPDDNKILLEGDLEQAEARIVAWLAEDEEMMEVFHDPKRNIHAWNAARMFGGREEDIERDSSPTKPYGKAKRIVHAFNYGLGAIHAADLIGCSVAEAKTHKKRYFRAFPKLVAWQDSIRKGIKNNRVLITPLGRRRLFLGRPNEDLVRKMLAFVPQSTCVDYLNMGLIRTQEALRVEHLEEDCQFLIQTHDGFVGQCSPENLNNFKFLAKHNIEKPIIIKNRFLTIPLKLKTGMNWGEME